MNTALFAEELSGPQSKTAADIAKGVKGASEPDFRSVKSAEVRVDRRAEIIPLNLIWVIPAEGRI